ncbi:MAG TPA: aminopeptidase N, partial [Sphingomonas sp.]
MIDLQAATALPAVTHREDYRPPDWMVPDLHLDFDLAAASTKVRATLSVKRNGRHDRALRLDGAGQKLLSVTVDGVAVNDWRLEDDQLVIPLGGDAHTIETEVEIAPDRNTQLMGLYASGGLLCTQCEAEGFRRITYFPDRPDVLTRYKVRMTADKARYPVLLANGDPIAAG